MSKLEFSIDKIMSVTDARNNFNKIVEEVEKDPQGRYLLTKGGNPSVVVVNVDYLEKLTGGEPIKAPPEKPEEQPKLAPVEETKPLPQQETNPIPGGEANLPVVQPKQPSPPMQQSPEQQGPKDNT
jgi:prevent-host-death family protein